MGLPGLPAQGRRIARRPYGAFAYRFDELPALRCGDFIAGSLDGHAEIEFLQDGDWLVTAITLDGHNGKSGGGCKTKPLPISRAFDLALWAQVESELVDRHAFRIAEAVECRLASDGITAPDPNDQHRLRLRDVI